MLLPLEMLNARFGARYHRHVVDVCAKLIALLNA
jgi:hypothetical protein